ncbi:MAG: hypothetical protein IPJ26_11475 [Bacteroidetes bacterium]|nr:hypothetical protein [Bacteroidota bacterium]
MDGPVIVEGAAGFPFKVLKEFTALPHKLVAETMMSPVMKLLLKVTLTEFVPCPELIIAPTGTDHQ